MEGLRLRDAVASAGSGPVHPGDSLEIPCGCVQSVPARKRHRGASWQRNSHNRRRDAAGAHDPRTCQPAL